MCFKFAFACCFVLFDLFPLIEIFVVMLRLCCLFGLVCLVMIWFGVT